MTYSPFTATGDGTTTQYTIAFEYIDTADIKARVNNVATTAFTVSGSTVTFTTAPPSGQSIKIFRDTDNQTIQADFQSGSALRAVDLNSNFTQLLYVTQESTDVADTATTDASAAVTTANAASATANTASTNASNAVSTANTASANATTALNNSRESDGSGGFNSAIDKANTALTTANSATTTANTANTAASSAVSTANTASTNATTAVNTANTASTNATAAVNTANTASTNASTALSTANAASTNATAALNNSRESDGSGGFTTAIAKANTALSTANTASSNASTALSTANTASTNASNAVTTANAASTAVSNAAFYAPVANVAAIPGSPANEDRIEILDSTGIQSFSPLSGLPSGFTGSSDLTVRLQYSSSASSWEFKQYFAADPENRYATNYLPVIKGDGTSSGQVGKITLNCSNNNHGVAIQSPPHSAGATYTLTLPTALPTVAGQSLTSDTSGNLGFTTVDAAFVETPQTISTSKVIGANINAGMMGPTVTIASGVTITVGQNSQLTVLS
jgi:hypothetical protein|tara:strand:+ start:15972 stop:17516 length:1545 start_codon:yes stop_codon:yes gene_type:complete